LDDNNQRRQRKRRFKKVRKFLFPQSLIE